jgi:glycosyltransferase involved in cell wall biosynthesis
MKLCIFPNDPIMAYYEKGEIKKQYYNPENFFDEIHIISFIEKDIDAAKVKILVGNSILKIYSVGKINLKNRNKRIKKIIELVKTINPDVIRAYNPLVEGWFAAKCAKELNIPFFLSLHTQFDYNRKLVKKTNLKKFLALKYTEKFIEPFVLKTADKITIVFKIIEPYVLKHVNQKPEILHNKIDFEKYVNADPIESLPKPLIISVGRLIPQKNHECIIRAMKRIDAHYLIIGDGDLFSYLSDLIKNLKMESKVTIKKSIPNIEIPNYYKSAQIFALAYDPEQEGLPIPVIEAMASGLPVIIPNLKHEYSEGMNDVVIFSERNPSSFSEKIQKLLDNVDLQKKYARLSQNKAQMFDNKKIERREREIYQELIKNLNKL